MKDLQLYPSNALLPAALERLLPPEVTNAVYTSGAATAEEIRLHTDRFCTVRSQNQTYPTNLILSPTRMRDILHMLCAGSIYAYEESLRQGYLIACHGVRVGVCGHAATENGKVIGVAEISALVIRIPHHVSIQATVLSQRLLSENSCGGMLVYAPPGMGKTTLLRAITRECATPPSARHTVVVDTREEIGYGLAEQNLYLSILSAFPRKLGIEIAVRSLGAQLIVCDEIGNDDEIDAILAASNCGVPLLASVHGGSLQQIFSRSAIRKLHQAGVFQYYVGLQRRQNDLHFSITSHEQADKLLSERSRYP